MVQIMQFHVRLLDYLAASARKIGESTTSVSRCARLRKCRRAHSHLEQMDRCTELLVRVLLMLLRRFSMMQCLFESVRCVSGGRRKACEIMTIRVHAPIYMQMCGYFHCTRVRWCECVCVSSVHACLQSAQLLVGRQHVSRV